MRGEFRARRNYWIVKEVVLLADAENHYGSR